MLADVNPLKIESDLSDEQVLFLSDILPTGYSACSSADPSRPSPADRRLIAAVTAVIADDLDRRHDITETARIVAKACAGVVLTRGGDVLPLPGLPDDDLLAPGSPVLTVAADELANSGAYTSFLVPAPDTGGQQLIRVTALDLRILGLLVEGLTDLTALAQALQVAGDTVANSLGRCLATLGTTELSAAAVRALRVGMRIPPLVMGVA